jgi:hypothetical protein
MAGRLAAAIARRWPWFCPSWGRQTNQTVIEASVKRQCQQCGTEFTKEEATKGDHAGAQQGYTTQRRTPDTSKKDH